MIYEKYIYSWIYTLLSLKEAILVSFEYQEFTKMWTNQEDQQILEQIVYKKFDMYI